MWQTPEDRFSRDEVHYLSTTIDIQMQNSCFAIKTRERKYFFIIQGRLSYLFYIKLFCYLNQFMLSLQIKNKFLIVFGIIFFLK